MSPRSPVPDPPRIHARLFAAGAALAAVLLIGGMVEGFTRALLPAHLDRFALTMPPVKLTGNVLQTTAFRTRGVLPIYGSSELDRPAANRPDVFFQNRPTGFSVFPIGRAGNTCLIILEKIAATGEAVRGQKVAIFLSPSWFLRDAGADAVDNNLRPLQLGTWVFGRALSEPLKGDIARRLLAYPETLGKQPLLNLALESLAAPTAPDGKRPALDRLRLLGLEPFGRLQNFFLERTEYWAILRDLPSIMPGGRRHAGTAASPGVSAPGVVPNWEELAARAEAHDRALGEGSPYSVGGPADAAAQHHAAKWTQPEGSGPGGKGAPGKRDADFDFKLAHSSEWADLGLLLRVLRELGADALIVSQPFNGVYRDLGGNSPQARRAYYARLDAAVRGAGYSVRDFSEHEEDKYFFNDSGHPSAKAWIFYDRALDEFYRQPTPPR